MNSPYELKYKILKPVTDAHGNSSLCAAISEFIDDWEEARERAFEVLRDSGAVILEAVICGPRDFISVNLDCQTMETHDGVLCSYRIMQMQKMKGEHDA